MYFDTKNYLKSTHNHIVKQALTKERQRIDSLSWKH